MSAPSTPVNPGAEQTVRTRRSVLAGGVAGALGATVLAPAGADAQVLPPDDRYVWRSRMPVNVKDKGARGDGLTTPTDDTAAIQSAINDVAATGGGTVFFPPGDYVVNGGLTIPAEKPIRLLGSGATLNSNGTVPWPTRLIRKSGSTTVISAIGSGTNRVWFELSDLEVRGGGTAGNLVDVQIGNTCQFHRVNFAGTVGIGLRMRNVYNSSGSHLRWHSCGNGAGSPACLFDAVNASPGGSDTVLWDKLQFEGNSGTDLKLTGNASNDAGTVTTEIQMSQIKMEGGNPAAANCPYIDLDYSQNCKFSDVEITVHGGRTVPPLRKAHPFGGTRADKFVNLTIDNTQGDNFPYGIDHSKGALQLENVTILGPATAAIKVNSTVGASEFQLGKLVTNVARPVIDSRGAIPTVSAAATINPPRERLVGVSGSSGSITSISAHESGFMMTLKFAGGPTVAGGGNLHLANGANFVTTADDMITLISDGTGWFEVSRTVL
ncbi:MAG TPA: glycosyl hydrolase family 28-related protein [Thermoleophilaceae bacterium]|nr:glycosyl hydrolase family 28-related protein [Thermoleophilaceae bacterium]